STSPFSSKEKDTGLLLLDGIGTLLGFEDPTFTPSIQTTQPLSAPMFSVSPVALIRIFRRSQMLDRVGVQYGPPAMPFVENGSSPPCNQPSSGAVKSFQTELGSLNVSTLYSHPGPSITM